MRLLWLFIFTISAALPLAAMPIKGGSHSSVNLHSEAVEVKPGETFFLAFEITLAPHWHTYYKNPGDSGAPTTVKFKNAGLTAEALLYPPPQKIIVPPLTSFGYHDRLILLLPVTITDSAKGESIILAGKLDYLECREACLPAGGDFSLPLKLGLSTELDASEKEFFVAARSHLPQKLPFELKSISENQFVVNLPVFATEAIAIPDPLGSEDVQPPKISIEKNLLTLNFAAGKARNESLLLSIRDESTWSHWLVSLPQFNQSTGVWYFLLFAILGGVLLNFMPCVLPVLSLKAVSLVKADSAQKSIWGYTCGVIVTFSAIGGLFLILRATGQAVGWGFQLQTPLFVALMALLFTAISLNLLGAFEITIPAFNVKPVLGDFFTGVLAVLAATPCTAPFMATALGAALTLPAIQGFLIFPLLGLGMSFPFLLIILFPRTANFLPRPGAWFNTFKGVLGFMMVGSALWLVFIFNSLTGAAFYLLIAALVFSFALFVYGKHQTSQARPVVKLLRFVTIFTAFIVTGWFIVGGVQSGQKQISQNQVWQNFLPAARDKALTEHQAVFVDFTADWCLSCKVNERIAFTEKVMTLLHDRRVVLFKADFTMRDETIARELAQLNRAGVPVYAFYEKSGKLHLLPEVLTEQLLTDKIQNLTR